MLPLIAAISCLFSITFSPIATAKLFDGPIDRLPLEQRVALKKGELVFLGKDGNYTSRLLISTTVDSAWQVLTDYKNFANFLPGVVSSELLESNGDRKIFEQINKIKTLVFSIESRVKVATIESYPKQIAFEAVDGDLKTMNGTWVLEPVSPYPSAPPDQVLVTHKVVVEPAKAPSDSIFYSIYEDRLQETLKAIKKETERRAKNQ
ncbi:MAG: cyclase/dehydrase [Pleurocapsa sp. SU_5_0]|nr:cyclase/dehydrase [Pleurocapsa sp. SU_5_0]NJO95937.1 cyclase/dehydrase [Pleurocapsa sp. CRU_1_2]